MTLHKSLEYQDLMLKRHLCLLSNNNLELLYKIVGNPDTLYTVFVDNERVAWKTAFI